MRIACQHSRSMPRAEQQQQAFAQMPEHPEHAAQASGAACAHKPAQQFCGTDAAAQTTATKAAQATAAQPHVCVIPESKR